MNTKLILVGALIAGGCAKTAYIASGESDVSMQIALTQARQQVHEAEERGCTAKDIATGVGLSQGVGVGIGEGFTLSENCPECNDTLAESSKSKEVVRESRLFAVNVLMLCPVDTAQ